MSNLGVVTQEDRQFVAKIATYDLGKQYRFAGPLRGDDERLAYQDLCYIRAAAEGAPWGRVVRHANRGEATPRRS